MVADEARVRLRTYVVARDFGFAPNPFHGYCTLCTCKPDIRRLANVGDWIVGTGSAVRKRAGHLVFAMEVAETMTFNEYWSDPRFQRKKPNFRGSKKQAFGDNIYCRDAEGWHQQNSHHSLKDGTPNVVNIRNDTRTNRVLVATNYVYWGGMGPPVPTKLRGAVCIGRGHRANFDAALESAFIDWLRRLPERGYQGDPLDWKRSP